MLLSYLARLAIVGGKAQLGRSRLTALDESRLHFRVWPSDIDTYGHVNNGRFLTLMDLGRFDHTLRSGLFRTALRNQWRPLVAEATVKFRRELRLGAPFDLATRLVHWDEKWRNTLCSRIYSGRHQTPRKDCAPRSDARCHRFCRQTTGAFRRIGALGESRLIIRPLT
jgi:acyl-CoA thioesterase FadM